MRVHSTYLRSTGSYLPAPVPVDTYIADGSYPPNLARTASTEAVRLSERSAAEMAVDAAHTALHRAKTPPANIGLLLHAATYHQGQDLWPVASYIQRETLKNSCSALEIRQMSNGGLAAMELAASHINTHPGHDVLITAADRFCEPGIDRWQTDPGTPYGDGASAIVLSGSEGFAEVVSLSLHADAELEELHRGDIPFSRSPLGNGTPIDFGAAKDDFIAKNGIAFAAAKAAQGQRTAIDTALQDAAVNISDLNWAVLPHFGLRRLNSIYTRPFGIELERTNWSWSRTVGHLGAADQFASLDHMATTGLLQPGQMVALVSVGAGYTWGCAVLRITSTAPTQLRDYANVR